MISLDQVILLEKKVESAVAKIQQLKAENDALRSKCSELTNALSAKSEQLSSFVNDQSQIENGIKKALDRLNSIENSVLKSASSIESDGSKPNSITQQATFQDMKPVTSKPAIQPKTVQQPVAVPVQKPMQPVMQEEPVIEEPVISETIPSMYMEEPEEEITEEGFAPDPAESIETNSFADEIFDRPIGSFEQDFSTEIPEETYSETNEEYQQTEAPEDFDNNSEGQTDLGFDIF